MRVMSSPMTTSSKVGLTLLVLLSFSSTSVNAFTTTTSNGIATRTFHVPSIPNHATPQHSFSTALFLDGKGMAGGSQHLLGDVLRSLQPRYISRVADAVRGKTKGMRTFTTDKWMNNNEGLPSWEELSKQLYNAQTPSERDFRSNLQAGSGSPSSLASQRLFGQPQPLITLYRDSASWCPYCQKVWIALEEQQIPYEIKKVDMTCYGAGKPEEFLQIQPNGNLPVAIVLENGEVYSESDDILDWIDGRSKIEGKKPLRPEQKEERIKELCDDGRNSLERRLYSRWMWYLTGVRKPAEYKQIYEEHVDEVEQALAETATDGPFFLGEDISIVDILFAPFVERQEASLAYYKGFTLRDDSRWPNLVKWMEAMEARESYISTKSDWYTHSRALPPQLAAGCSEEKNGEEMRCQIDASPTGSSSSSDATTEAEKWYEPGWEQHPSYDPAMACREAAERIINNNEKLVSFASRGAGIPGLPASSAPLADPRSISNESLKYPIDVFLRLVVSSLLSKSVKGVGAGSFFQGLMVGDSGGEEGSVAAREEMVTAAQDLVASVSIEGEQGGGGEAAEAVADCLDYVRARIGVPRDMSYPAAREFRNELLFCATSLRKSSSAEAIEVEKEVAVSQ